MATMTEPTAEKRTLVHYLVESGVAILELDDPPANTYTHEMMRQLDEAILKARFDDAAHVLVLRGHGDKFFSAGANISMLNSVTPRFKYFFCLHANETLNRLEHTPKLTIAALNGHTVGGGLEIAMACDIRVAKENAGKIGLPEVNLGVLPGSGGTQRLARSGGKARAIEMMVKGETFSFDKAKELGLVNEVFPADNYWEQVLLYAKQFCPPHKASRCRSRAASPSSASCNSSCSRATTPRKGSPPTTRSGSRNSGVSDPVRADLFINNEWRPAASGRRFPVVNPATEDVIAQVAQGDAADVDAAVTAARACFESDGWRKLSARQRGRLLAKTADLLEARLDEFARLETAHNGKTLFESKIELGMTVNTLRYYGGWADKIVGDTLPVDGPFFVYTLREPIGVVGAIVPWNFPLNIASWKFAPALATGCTIVLKPASETPLTALLWCATPR